MNIILIVFATICIPLLLTYFIYLVAYRISGYDFVRKRMDKRKTIVLLLIEQEGKILFRRKQGLHPAREEYRDTWVLPGGEIELDRGVSHAFSGSSSSEILLHKWAVAYTEHQMGIKVTCPEQYAQRPFSESYEGGIQMGYPPGKIIIYCAEIVEDGPTRDVIQRILNDELDDKKFFLVTEVEARRHFFHPFYIKHLEAIAGLRAKIQRDVSQRKVEDNNITERLKERIQTLHEEIHP